MDWPGIFFFGVLELPCWRGVHSCFHIPKFISKDAREGTLSSAFIPVFAETIKVKSKEKAFNLLNQVTSRLVVFLGVGSL